MQNTHPSHSLPRDPATLTRQERDAAIVARRAQGLPLAAIGAEFGVTRERVRQIVAANGGPSHTGVRRIRAAQERVAREALRDRCLKHLADFPGLTLAELAEALGEHASTVRKALGDDAHRLLASAPRTYARASDEALLGELRLAAGLIRGPLTGGAYDRIARGLALHSRARQIQRFGTWAAACELAGVTPGQPRRGGYTRRWTADEMLLWVARYLDEPGSRGTYAGYDAFAKRTPGAPGAQTVRKAVGPWSTIKSVALRREFAVVSSAPDASGGYLDRHVDSWVA